ncbi:MAG: hypothetical protein ACW98X_20675 [Promethearchaeota archaeon]
METYQKRITNVIKKYNGLAINTTITKGITKKNITRDTILWSENRIKTQSI